MNDQSYEGRTIKFYIKRISGLILLLSMAAVFLFSGISKLYSFDQFTWNIMDAGVTNMTFASVLARLFIGLELLLGLCLLAHLFLRSFTYPAVIAILGIFTAYLVLIIFRQGNTGNCGCFGDAFKMTPSAAIVKNLVMIALTTVLIYLYPVKPYRNAEWIAAFAGMASLVVPFLFFPMSLGTKPHMANDPIDLTPLYQSENPANSPPSVELRKGKHIVAFMSLTCPHCRKAAFLIQVIHRQNPEIPLFMVLNGHPDLAQEFFKESRSESVPHILFRGPDEFMSMAGPSVPAIYWINNSVIERKSNYMQIDPSHMWKWLR
jgi:uncharacterized membrane protein YphA (DoxX/SURF4 family)